MLKLSPDEAALLKAVCADRDNDLPRLVYADWLDDHGRPERAEFIRLQCHPPDPPGTAHVPRQLVNDTWRVAAPATHRDARAAELLDAHSARWLRELPAWATALGPQPFVRGFVEAFEFPVSQFLLHGPQLLDRTPARWLRLRAVRKLARRVVKCGWFREVPHLSFTHDRLDNRWVVELTDADWLAHTRFLSLSSNELRDGAAIALARCGQLRGLRTLDMGFNDLTRAGVETLLASSHLTDCRLDFNGNPRLMADPHTIRRLLGPRGTL